MFQYTNIKSVVDNWNMQKETGQSIPKEKKNLSEKVDDRMDLLQD